MKADTLEELYWHAAISLCPTQQSRIENAVQASCTVTDCMAWRERAIPGRKTSASDDPPVACYEGWCGLAGAPGDENDYRSKHEA